MKVPVPWLKEFVPVPSNVEALAHRLTMGGFEVEEIFEKDGEKILEVNVTPNRGDCLSILGIAREVGALYGVSVRRPKATASSGKKGPLRAWTPVSVSVKSPAGCPRYSMVVISGVKIGPSPLWLVRRLELSGIRTINNVVDVTNYVLLETGQPLHAFDHAKISGKISGSRVIVRQAKAGEKILTLDGEERELQAGDLVIADAERPIAIAGVMGGKETEIDDQSKTIALECAFFNPSTIRRTSRRLGLQTDSSYRFERRVDPEGVIAALERAVSLIREVSGGEAAGTRIDLRQSSLENFQGKKISFDPVATEARLGGGWRPALIRQIFRKLNLRVSEKGARHWEVLPPSYRGDLGLPADLMEEVVRLGGIERIPVTFPVLHSAPHPLAREQILERDVRGLLRDLGFHEAIHFSFLSPRDLADFDPALVEQAVSLGNPLSAETSVLRQSLLPSLLKTAGTHHRHKIFAVRLFELRKCFVRGPGGIVERKMLSAILTGPSLMSHWSQKPQETDFSDMKGVVQRLFEGLEIEDVEFIPGQAAFLHPRRQALLQSQGENLGVLGEIHPDVLHRMELKRAAYVFELDWASLLLGLRPERRVEEFSRFPVVERDLALVVDEGIAAGSLSHFIKRQDVSIRKVSFFDLYRGVQVPEGKKSLAFSIQLGQKDKTLTDEEVNLIHGRVIENVKKEFGAEVR